MRNKLYRASYLVFAAALATTGSAFAGESVTPTPAASSQTNHTTLAQTGNGAITVPPGVARGFGNYPDGTPCIGTPKDPTAFPDKKTNPCDGKPLAPEQLPGPFPPAPPAVNVTAPGGQTVPPTKPEEPDHRAGQFAPYEDGTPCVGRPKDLFRRPNKETNPCVPVEEQKSSEPNGNHTPIPAEQDSTGNGGTTVVPSFTPKPRPGANGVPTIKQRPDGSLYIEYPDKPADKPVYDKPRGPWVRPQQKQSSADNTPLRGLALSSQAAGSRPADHFDYKTEPGDPAKGEDTIVSAYERASGRLSYRTVNYLDGRVVIQYFRDQDGTLRKEMELVPYRPDVVAYRITRVTLYAADGINKVQEVRFRQDLTMAEVDDWGSRGFVRTYYDVDGTTVLRKVNFDKDGNPILQHQDKSGAVKRPILLLVSDRPGEFDYKTEPGAALPKPTPSPDAKPHDSKPTPYLPPFTALRPAGEVTDLTPENQSIVNTQVKNLQRPVFRLVYSSADPRSRNMSDWLDRAAKANPAVVFLRLDTTKIAVATPTPSVNLDIPRPTRSFSETGYRTDAQLDNFLRDGLSAWTPITKQRP